MGKYQVKKSTNGQFYWTLKASNGEPLLASETFATKQNCLNGIASSKQSVADSNFQRLTGSGSQPYYFNQRANNYEVLAKSEMYSSEQARENGISAVKREAPTATTEDLT